ncbi:winged helix-turn-helix domain-containing protein [Nonomuraea sp. AD125B]|uniref:helix-turn-helix domain-containing protein n=1 Tax=Nonomuraea TaxID=83681 RepID=UPI0031D32EEB
MLIGTDSGGGTREFLNWLTRPGCWLKCSIGFTITDDIAAARRPPATHRRRARAEDRFRSAEDTGKTVIGRRFHRACMIQGVRKLLARNGWSWQVPGRRAVERDDGVVAGWAKEVWPCAEDSRRPVEPGSSSRTEPDSP